MSWYIVRNSEGTCAIQQLETTSELVGKQFWGPFPSAEEAIARRIGLIRAQKCRPQ